MDFESEVKQTKTKLANILQLTEADSKLLQDIKDAGKQIKKVVNVAEEGIEQFEREVEKTHKELKKIKDSQNEELSSEVLKKIKEYEEQFQQQRRDELKEVISQIEEIIQESKKTLTNYKKSLCDDSNPK